MTTETFINKYYEDDFIIELTHETPYVAKKLEERGIQDSMEVATSSLITIGHCDIEWEFAIEMRSWGIKGLSFYAVNAKLELIVEESLEDKEIVENIEVDLSEWEIDTHRLREVNKDIFHHHIRVSEVYFDFKEKTIDVEF